MGWEKHIRRFRLVFISLFILQIFQFCSDSNKDNNEQKNNRGKFSWLRKKMLRETVDTSDIDFFLTKYPLHKIHKEKLTEFYRSRNFELAWSEEGKFLPQADMFVNLLKNIQSHELNPMYDPYLKQKLSTAEEAKKPQRKEISKMRRELDLLLTASFFEYAGDIWKGRINPENYQLDWHIARKTIKPGQSLKLILGDVKNENPFIQHEPLHPQYKELKNVLDTYTQIKNTGGWNEVNARTPIKKGNKSTAVKELKKRLSITGEYKSNKFDEVFTHELENAVKKFQRNHGLEISGVVNSKTLKALNIPVEDRIEQLSVNMERWRWMPETLPSNYVWINIPEFKLYVLENDHEVMEMNVIVGKEANSTPIFNDIIENIVVSPSWNIPKVITEDEIIPSIQRDTNYITRHSLEILKDGKPIDSDSIDWNNLTEEDYEKITIKQPSSVPTNPLGHIKFLFPNEYEVYLHDTPQGKLFSQTERDFSHGCIRLEKPAELAEYLLRNDSTWTKESIKEAMNSGIEESIPVKPKEPVYIVYFTAWVDKGGELNFREDLYHHDEKLNNALSTNVAD